MVTLEPPAHPLRSLIRRFDAFQRRRQGVYEYCDAADCLLRIQVRRAPHALELGNLSLAPGDQVIELHLWNEHMPPMPASGPDLAWAREGLRLFVGSLRTLAQHMRREPELADVRAVVGVLAFLAPRGHPGGVRVMERWGFSVQAHHSPLGRFGEFWENFYTWWVMWTYNPGSLTSRRLTRMERTEIWTSTDDFLRRYG